MQNKAEAQPAWLQLAARAQLSLAKSIYHRLEDPTKKCEKLSKQWYNTSTVVAVEVVSVAGTRGDQFWCI